MIIEQADRDVAIRDLQMKLSEVYTFLMKDVELAEIPTMQELFGKLAKQTLECAVFIKQYSETKSECELNALRRCRHVTLNVVLYRGKTCQECVQRN